MSRFRIPSIFRVAAVVTAALLSITVEAMPPGRSDALVRVSMSRIYVSGHGRMFEVTVARQLLQPATEEAAVRRLVAVAEVGQARRLRMLRQGAAPALATSDAAAYACESSSDAKPANRNDADVPSKELPKDGAPAGGNSDDSSRNSAGGSDSRAPVLPMFFMPITALPYLF